MNLRELCEVVWVANRQIAEQKLAVLTWGNASAFESASGLMAIKPSGVDYADLTPAMMVVLDVESGDIVSTNNLRASSDTPTHRALYRGFGEIGGIVHTHSPKATAWAQGGKDIPCLGTTHADHFFGDIPCTERMTDAEIHHGDGYETNTATVILRTFAERGLNALEMPAVLVRDHAPFVWGNDLPDALHNAIALEMVAAMALDTLTIRAESDGIGRTLLHKHFQRKHGADAYYGQK